VKTLNQIVAEVENWASSHLQVHSFGQGDIWEISPSSSQFTFPLMWVTVGQSDPREMEMVDQFNVLVCDLVDTGEKNELEVLSDTRQILRDLVAWYRQQHSAAYIVEFQGSITPFTERFAERVSGHALTIRLRQPYDYDSCAIPLGTPLPAPPFCEPATFTLINTATPPATLDSGSIPSGGSDVIVAPAVTVIAANSQNTQIGPTVTPPSGGSDVIPLPDVTHTQTYGNPETLPNGVALVCDPALDGAVQINGDAVANVPSGGTVNIMVEQDGNPVGAFDPNTNSWVIPPCATGGSVSLAISDTTPTLGDTITLTATAIGFSASRYLFATIQGNDCRILADSTSDTFNWTVDQIGTFDVFVLSEDAMSSVQVFNYVEVTATSNFFLDIMPNAATVAFSLRKLRSAYNGPCIRVLRTSDNTFDDFGFSNGWIDVSAMMAFVGASDGRVIRWYGQDLAGIDAIQNTAGSRPFIVQGGNLVEENGRPAMFFNNHFLETIPINLPQPTTQFGVGRIDPSYSTSTIYTFASASIVISRQLFLYRNTGRLAINAGNSIEATGSSSSIQFVFSALFNGANSVGRFNGNQFVAGDAGTQDFVSTLNIGLQRSVDAQQFRFPWFGKIQEFAFFNQDESANFAIAELNIKNAFNIP